MEEDRRNRVAVKIMGQEYMIRGSASPEQMKKVARYVHDLMSELAQKNPRASLYKIAILTAINLANEKLQQDNDDEKDQRKASLT